MSLSKKNAATNYAAANKLQLKHYTPDDSLSALCGQAVKAA
jgi:hypothetical protein